MSRAGNLLEAAKSMNEGNIKFREFKKGDHEWDAFAGAEAPPGGKPLIGEAKLLLKSKDEIGGIVLVDAAGIGLYFIDEVDNWAQYNYLKNMEFAEAVQFARKLNSPLKEADLRKNGFYEV